MIELKNINEHGLLHICSAIIEIIINDGRIRHPGQGINVGGTYLTRETCYWLYNLLQESPELYAKRTAIDTLIKGMFPHETF